MGSIPKTIFFVSVALSMVSKVLHAQDSHPHLAEQGILQPDQLQTRLLNLLIQHKDDLAED